MLAEPLHLFPAAAGILYQARAAGGAARGGAGDFRGQNRPYGIQLTYSLDAPGLPLPDPGKERERRGAGEKEPKVEIRIANTAGKLVRKLEGPARLGVNRAVWDLGRKTVRRPPTDNRGRQRDEESGPAVPPGTYRVTIRYRDHEAQGTVRVVADPFTRNTGADWQAREAAIARAGRLEDALVTAIERLRSTRTDLDVVLKKLEPTDPRKAEEGTDANQPLQKAARDLRRKLGEVERRLWIPPGTQGIVDDQTAYTKAEDAERTLETSWDPPNPTHRAKLEAAAAAARTALAAVNDFFAHDVAGFRRQLADARIDLLAPQEPIGVGTP